MFTINKEKNEVDEICKKTFKELGFDERKNLQEWIAKNPKFLGEELLIIQKEFSKFEETNERLDLLALDKEGNLVIIENKLDDTGKNVVWQALKYASYCSSLTKKQILDIYQEFIDKFNEGGNAQELLLDFLNAKNLDEIKLNQKLSQRIFFVAAKFRKEVTSTVLWLMEYNIKIKCFKVTPFKINDTLILNPEQIIPMKDSEDYIVSMAEKNQENIVEREKSRNREKLNKSFWKEFLDRINKKNTFYQNINPTSGMWLWKSAGIVGIGYSLVISKTYARVEFSIGTSNKESNKKIFNALNKDKKEIESDLGYPLVWEKLEKGKSSRIKYEIQEVSVDIEEDWDKMITFLIENVVKFEEVFGKKISQIKILIKS